MIHKEIANVAKGYHAINERIILIRLGTRPVGINIIQVYAPTTDAPDEEAQLFYDQVNEVLGSLSRREINIVMGDFNAKIGKIHNDEYKHLRKYIGQYTIGDRNARGDKLIQFVIDQQMSVMNTMFKNHARRLITRISPGNRVRNQIDFILINAVFSSQFLLFLSNPF